MQDSNIYLKKIKSHFKDAVKLQQNCKIYVCTVKGDSWSFYFKKGCLIWASSSIHRFRRLYRLTNQVCPEVNCNNTELREQEISELWEYLFLNILYKRKQVSKEQVQKVIQLVITEVLFDCLISDRAINQVKIIFETKGNQMGAILGSSLFKNPVTSFNYTKNIHRIESSISSWNNIKLANYSPNLAPVIKDIAKLKKAVVDFELYQQLFAFINGKRTIRDLAAFSKQDLLSVAKLLLPHIKSKAIALQEIPDLQLANLYFSPTSQEIEAKYPNSDRDYVRELDLPLVICVDDNPLVCQHITQLLNPIGYRILSINDAVKTLMVLLENQPSLIFINADMPDANGYELCAQIKRMSALKDVPIVILSRQEGVVNKLRGRMSGAVDIINKPINSTEILTITQKYTQSFVNEKELSTLNSSIS